MSPQTVRRRTLLAVALAAIAAPAVTLTYDAGPTEPAGSDFPELDGAETFYGVTVTYIGEDGYMMAFGHHADPRPVIAAMNRLARTQCGLENMLDDPRATYSDVADRLHEDWAIQLHDRCLECGNDPHCKECQALRLKSEDEWCLRWGEQDNPAAFPITLWRC